MPKRSNSMITRNNLMRKLDDLSEGRIIYICAPAGYGKTVAVQEWLARSNHKSMFVSLDELDNDLKHFCGRFCAALCDYQPKNATLGRITAHPAFDSAPDKFTLRAIAALSGNKRASLVIDDLHFVYDERVLRLLLNFLKRLPETFQIMLISRNELPTGYSELWLKGNLSCVTADDLRFNCEEITLLYEKRGYLITPKQADEIRMFTDGWAIGVGALLLSGGAPHGDNLKYLDEFILENVWQRWDETTREFMLKTSVVRELAPPLCNLLNDNQDSENLLNQLVQQNAFISQTKQGVYRYHKLFRDFLCKMLNERGDKYSHPLLEKAGLWYLEQKDFYSAVDCFVKCENHDGIIKCFRFIHSVGREYSFVDKLRQIAKLSMLQSIAEKHPQIYSLLSWDAFIDGRPDDLAYYSDRYYANHSEIVRLDPHLTLSILFVSLVDFRNTFSELVQSAKKISMNSEDGKLSDMRNALGTVNQHMPLLHRGTRDFSECAGENAESGIMWVMDLFGGLFGDEANLFTECLTAGILYEQGYQEKAYSHAIAANAEIQEHFVPETKFFAMAIQVYILDALAQQEQSDKMIEQITEMIEEENAYYLSYNFSALTARRKLGKGDIKAANDWITEIEPPSCDSVDFYKIYGHLTTCRAYIAKGDYNSAITLLTKVLVLAESYNRPLDIIETQILLSIAFWKKKRGFQAEAMRYLEQAASMAYRYGYTQLFVNESAELSSMLRRLQKRAEQRIDKTLPSSFIKMLYLKTLEHEGNGLTSGLQTVPAKYTDKQRTVMKLLCKGKTFKEIAEIMGITLPTLRSHISLIYKKLDVTREMDAIAKIKALGILEDE